MIIKKAVIEQINNRQTRINLCLKLNCGEQGLVLHISKNRDNGRLTKMDALMAISEETGIPVMELTEELVVSEAVQK